MRRLAAVFFCLVAGAAQAEPPPEGARFLGNSSISATADGGLRLEDGRAVTLAGIDAATLPPDWQSKSLRIYSAAAPDRWGRLPVYLFDSSGHWLQAELVEQGAARVVPLGESAGALRRLLAGEAKARAAGLQIWADHTHGVLSADQANKAHQSFALVQGRVVAVGLLHGVVTLTLGDDGGKGLLVHISADLRRRLPGDPLLLRERQVLVRGWVGGGEQAVMDLVHPARLQLLEGAWPPKAHGSRQKQPDEDPS